MSVGSRGQVGKRIRERQLQQELPQTAPRSIEGLLERVRRAAIPRRVRRAAEAESKDVLDEAAASGAAASQLLAQLDHAFEGSLGVAAAHDLAGVVDGASGVVGSPPAHGVEVFERI